MSPLALLVLLIQLFRLLNVTLLRGFVPADQKEDEFAPTLSEIQAIAQSVVDTQLAYAISDRFVVTKVACYGYSPDA